MILDHRSCTSDQFECGSGECIDSDQLCDLTRHCIDGTDEQNCGG